MPSFNIHLAIARKYIENHNDIINEDEFLKGNIEPDLVIDKSKSHYSGPQDKNKLIEYLKNKVVIEEYLKQNIVETDYDKGVFLHLLTDYLFFREFFDKEYLQNVSYEQFRKDLYYSYDITNKYLETKYNTSYEQFKDEIEKNIKKSNSNANYNKQVETNIIPTDKLDKFIEEVSNIDLIEYKNR